MPKPVKTDEDSDRRKIFSASIADGNGRMEVKVTWRNSIAWKTVVKRLWWYVAFPVGGVLAALKHFGLL